MMIKLVCEWCEKNMGECSVHPHVYYNNWDGVAFYCDNECAKGDGRYDV